METSIVEFIKVTKSFSAHMVLEDFSLTINKTDKIAILGKSGIGKSTILKLICGIVEPDEGLVVKDIKKIGYVFQEPRLLPWLSTLENIKLPLISLNFSDNQATKIAHEYLQIFHLEPFAKHFPSQLSGGMAQRVSIARALCISPEILLLDEPFSALDAELKKELISIVYHHAKQFNIPILHVTHLEEEIKSFTNKTLHIINSKKRIMTQT